MNNYLEIVHCGPDNLPDVVDPEPLILLDGGHLRQPGGVEVIRGNKVQNLQIR